MRVAGYLLIAAALIAGALSAANAYLVRLDAPETALDGRVLNASAGVVYDPRGELISTVRQRGTLIPAAVADARTRRQMQLHVLIGSGDDQARELAADARTAVVALADRTRAAHVAPLVEPGTQSRLYLVCLGMERAQWEAIEAIARRDEQPLQVLTDRGGGVLLPVPLPAAWSDDAAGDPLVELAYLSLLLLPDRQLQQVRVDRHTSRVVLPNDQPIPLVGDDVMLTRSLIPRLRQAGVEQVRVKSFDAGLWEGRWAFALSIVALLAGAGLLRRVAGADERSGTQSKGAAAEPPEQILRRIQAVLHQTGGQVQQTEPTELRLQPIVEQLGRLQRELLPAFAESRPQLIARFGLSGFAQLMDRFAAAERQVNRAWSAAADGAQDEAVEALDVAQQRIGAAIQWLDAHEEAIRDRRVAQQ